MDRRSIKGSRLARKYQSGCACAVRLMEPVVNGRRMGSRHDSAVCAVAKAAMPPPEQISSSDDRLASAADETGAADERVNRGGERSCGRRKDSEAKGQRRPHRAAVTDLSCGSHHLKSRGSHGHGLGLGLGCRTVAELGDESFTKVSVQRTVRTKESAEAVVNQKFIDGEKSKQFMEALYILNSNKSLFVKLLEDPNSFLAKHIRELRESRENGRKSEAVSEVETVREVGKDEGPGTLSPRKLKLWEKLLPRRSADKGKSCEIVVLKPGLENKRGRGDRGPSFGSGGGSGNGIRGVKQSQFPFGSLRKMSKHQMGENHKSLGVEAKKLTLAPSYECKELDRESFVRILNQEDRVKELSNVSLAEIAAVDDSTLTKPDDDGPQLPQTFAESTNVAPMHSRTCRSPDLLVGQIELERIEIAERFLQDQTVSSLSDDSFSNSTEESETSADERPEEEHKSPVSVLDHHIASPIDDPPKLDRATSDMPLDKFGRAAEFMKSILTSSDLCWDTILITNHDSLNQLLRETGSNLHESCIDTRLFRDYVSEVIVEAIGHRWRSYQQGLIVVDGDVASDVMNRVDWDLALPQGQEWNSSECLIARDVTMKQRSSWMALGEETNEIVVELTRKIVEDVVNEIL